MKYQVLLLGIFIFVLKSNFLLAQGPLDGYLKGYNQVDIALSGSVETSDVYYFGDQKQELKNRFESLNLFVEWGISDSIDLVFTLPYVRTPKCDTCKDYSQGIQDASLFAKFRLFKKEKSDTRFKLLGALGGTLPVSNYQTGIERPIGIGGTVLHAKGITQYEWYSGPFIQLQSGVEVRISPDFLTSIPVLVRVGYGGRYLFAEAWFEYYYSINSGMDQTVLAGSGSTWQKIGASVYLPVLPVFGISLGTAHIINGSNIGLSSRYSLAAVYRFLGRK